MRNGGHQSDNGRGPELGTPCPGPSGLSQGAMGGTPGAALGQEVTALAHGCPRATGETGIPGQREC